MQEGMGLKSVITSSKENGLLIKSSNGCLFLCSFLGLCFSFFALCDGRCA